MHAWLPRMGNRTSSGGRRGRTDSYWQQQQQQDTATSLNMSYQVGNGLHWDDRELRCVTARSDDWQNGRPSPILQVDAAAQPPYVKQPTGARGMPPMPPAAEPNSLLDYFSRGAIQ